MTVMASTNQKLRELDEQESSAWAAYRDRLRELTGEPYERAEEESWQELQHELRHLARRRRLLEAGAPASA